MKKKTFKRISNKVKEKGILASSAILNKGFFNLSAFSWGAAGDGPTARASFAPGAQEIISITHSGNSFSLRSPNHCQQMDSRMHCKLVYSIVSMSYALARY